MSAALPTTSLIDLLGDTRAQVVSVLRGGAASVAELADAVGLSEVAVRRHLGVLERDGFVDSETVRGPGRGRPGARYRLTMKARRLFPDRSAELASELLDYLRNEHGRDALRSFLRWRAARAEARYGEVLPDGGATVLDRASALAAALSADGFMAEVRAAPAAGASAVPGDAPLLQLTQGHCAIREVAEAHPEICAYEAAMFSRVLGAKVSRRETIAGGAAACVCTITAPSVPPAAEERPHDGDQG